MDILEEKVGKGEELKSAVQRLTQRTEDLTQSTGNIGREVIPRGKDSRVYL